MMRQFLTRMLLLSSLSLISTVSLAGDAYSTTLSSFRQSNYTADFFAKSYGYAVFPTIGKGGLGVGAAHGKGKVYVKGQFTGYTNMTQLTVGFQIGGQAFSQIIFFQDKRSYDEFTSGNFEFGAQVSAVAITVGAQAQAGTTGSTLGANKDNDGKGVYKAKYHKGMAVFTYTKGGFMYEASVGGQKFNFTPKGQAKKKAKPKSAPAPSPVEEGQPI